MSISASPAFPELLQRKVSGLVPLAETQIARLQAHYELLLRWNRVLNLTTVVSPEEAVERHYCESLFLAAHLPPGPLRIADIGSGAGFPGFPVAILRTDCSVTLIEAHQRKAVFLREASRQVRNIAVISARASQVADSFDHAISRAVSYKDLQPVLKGLGNAADLLTGAEEPPESLGFTWGEPIPLPWGTHRFLRHGAAL